MLLYIIIQSTPRRIKIKSNQIKSNQIKSNQIKSNVDTKTPHNDNCQY